MSQPTLVTGATGFVGGHLLAALRGHGEPLRVIVRDASGLRDRSGIGGRDGQRFVSHSRPDRRSPARARPTQLA